MVAKVWYTLFMYIEYRKYLVHSFLQNFTQTLFYAFGALLMYDKTQSVLVVIVYGLVAKLSAVIIKTMAVRPLFRAINKIGIVSVMGAGLLLMAFSLVGIFYLNLGSTLSFLLLFCFSAAHSLGVTLYWTPSTAPLLTSVGSTSTPGKYNAIQNSFSWI